MSSQVITCAIQIPETKEKFICSAIYESNLEGERRHLWDDLRSTHSAYNHLNVPWILIGDYNVTLSSGEHSRARDYLPDQAGMRRFQEMVSDCALSDLAYVGALFTWWNQQEEDPIGKNLIGLSSTVTGCVAFLIHMLSLKQGEYLIMHAA